MKVKRLMGAAEAANYTLLSFGKSRPADGQRIIVRFEGNEKYRGGVYDKVHQGVRLLDGTWAAIGELAGWVSESNQRAQ